MVILLRDGPTVLLSGPAPLTRFVVDDFNGDGNPDVLYYSTNPAVTTAPTRFVTYLGDGHGHFSASPTTVEPQSVQWCGAGDLNGDARPDLVCDNYVLLANGNGTFRQGVAFTEPGLGASFPGVFFADVNRDGKLDVLAAAVFLGDGSGGLTLDTEPGQGEIGGRSSAVADLNHDGFVDLVYQSRARRLRGVTGQRLADSCRSSSITGLEDSAPIVLSDVNMDGRPDIVMDGRPRWRRIPARSSFSCNTLTAPLPRTTSCWGMDPSSSPT